MAYERGAYATTCLASVAVTLFALYSSDSVVQGQPPTSSACDHLPDSAEWCSQLSETFCNVEGAVGRAVRGACPSTCNSCMAGGEALDKVLQEGGTIEYRTGFVMPDPQRESTSVGTQKGWDMWLEKSGALSTGIPVGESGFVRIKHTTVHVTNEPDCDAYYRAAKELIDVHKIQAAVIVHHNCKTNLSMTYKEAGVVHFVQSGTPLLTSDGRPYVNKYSWYVHLDSNEYPRLFLKKMRFSGASKVAVVWRKGHDWTSLSAGYLMNTTLAPMDLELVYSYGWEFDQGGAKLSADSQNGAYSEAYNTDVWDSMLRDAAAAGANVLVGYTIGEGASIIKRMKALGISFSGVFLTVGPTFPSWGDLLGEDGDLVVSPAQWDSSLHTPCFMFGSAQQYASEFNERFGHLPDYTAATSTAAGLFLQLGIQMYSSVSSDLIIAGLQTMSQDTMFGRVRFSYAQRNIGRSPVGLQRQATELKLTLPEELATNQLQPFVDWPCRLLLNDTSSDVCSDAELDAVAVCSASYPDLITSACRERLAAEERRESMRRLLRWTLPLSLTLATVVLIFAMFIIRRWRNMLLIRSIMIPFDELHFISVDTSRASATTFNALGILSSTTRESSLKYAEWRGSKVVVRPIGVSSIARISAAGAGASLKNWTKRVTTQPTIQPTSSFMAKLNEYDAVSGQASPRNGVSSLSNAPPSPVPCWGNDKKALNHGKAQMDPASSTTVAEVAGNSKNGFAGSSSSGGQSGDTIIEVPDTNQLSQNRDLKWYAAAMIDRMRNKRNYLPGNIQAATSLRHPNVVAMLGVSVDKATGNEYVVMEPMALGSLHDVLQDEQLIDANDVATVVHILMSIVAGVRYLHGAKEPFVHCDIRAKNILLDEKLTAKVRTDIMPSQLLEQAKVGSRIRNKHKKNAVGSSFPNDPSTRSLGLPKYTAWTAPEVLCGQFPTCKSDVYALGMTMWEALTRKSPYAEEGCSNPMELPPGMVDSIVTRGQRPSIPSTVPSEIRDIIAKCWRQDPVERPDLDEIAFELKLSHVANPKKSGGTSAELKQSRDLLHQMLPPHIAEALQEGRKVEPEFFKEVTIFFSDIVGYTDISATMEPTKVMAMLDRLYQEFDSLTRMHGLFKVETIGDAYMCVGGLPRAQEDHAVRVARFALEAVRAANSVPVDLDNPDAGFVQIRVGFHSGPVVASVVGDLNPRYCLFGDTVNTAARMESNSKKNRINLSVDSRRAVEARAPRGFHYEKRGVLDIKGKGPMECFFLLGEAPAALIHASSAKSFSFKKTASRRVQRSASYSNLFATEEVEDLTDAEPWH